MRVSLAATALLFAAATTAGCAAGAPAARLATRSLPATTSTPATGPTGTASANPTPTQSPTPKGTPDPRDSDVPVQTVAPPSCPGTGPSPHFDTPRAAMRYLATAWNTNNLDALCHVTNPNARFLLNDMHREAVNLRFNHCNSAGVGAYICYFDHDYPAHMHKTGHGHAVFDVASADAPGWYMTVFEGCG